jgi:hypothetical protein
MLYLDGSVPFSLLQILTSASCQIFTHVMEPASICLGHTDAHQRKASAAILVQNTTRFE